MAASTGPYQPSPTMVSDQSEKTDDIAFGIAVIMPMKASTISSNHPMIVSPSDTLSPHLMALGFVSSVVIMFKAIMAMNIVSPTTSMLYP